MFTWSSNKNIFVSCRATSTANLRLFPTSTPNVPLSRRPSERELEPKKRASSAGGLYRNPGGKFLENVALFYCLKQSYQNIFVRSQIPKLAL